MLVPVMVNVLVMICVHVIEIGKVLIALNVSPSKPNYIQLGLRSAFSWIIM